MKEFDQYRIELTHEDIEKILTDYVEKLLNEKGYFLEYSHRAEAKSYPETTFRGIKSDNKSLKPT